MTVVPYRGANDAITALLGGEADFMTVNAPALTAHILSGKLRALAVTGEKRSPSVPDIPTVIEAGLPGFVVTAYYGIALPAKAQRPLVDRLNSEVVRALKAPDFGARLRDAGLGGGRQAGHHG